MRSVDRLITKANRNDSWHKEIKLKKNHNRQLPKSVFLLYLLYLFLVFFVMGHLYEITLLFFIYIERVLCLVQAFSYTGTDTNHCLVFFSAFA